MSASVPEATSEIEGKVSGDRYPPATVSPGTGLKGERKSVECSYATTSSANTWVTAGGSLTIEEGVWDVGYDVTLSVLSGSLGNVALWMDGSALSDTHGQSSSVSGVSRRTRIVVPAGQTKTLNLAIRSATATANAVQLVGASSTGSFTGRNNSQFIWAERV